jgi:hypothetical protein
MFGGERSKNIGPLKGRSKRFVGNVRVYFSCCNTGMTQQFLNKTNINAALD